jgi:Holliday junction resolvase RusA-like endonuclease
MARSPKKTRFYVELPTKPISTNNLYRGKKVRSYDYKKYRAETFKFLGTREEEYDLTGNLYLELEVGYSSPLSDLSNGIKGLEDVLTEYLGFNDRQVVTLVMNKFLVDKGSEYTLVTLRKTRKLVDKRTKHVKKKKQ